LLCFINKILHPSKKRQSENSVPTAIRPNDHEAFKMLEQIKGLKQLKAVENGYSIGVVKVAKAPIEVDTPENLDVVRSVFAGQ
jgi:CMP-2-keto-3-deoxyoctulosonic acid synthetase